MPNDDDTPRRALAGVHTGRGFWCMNPADRRREECTYCGAQPGEPCTAPAARFA